MKPHHLLAKLVLAWLLLIVCWATWLLIHPEPVPSYHLAQRFLSKEGVSVVTQAQVDWESATDPSSTTLVILEGEDQLTDHEKTALTTWVKAGGQLILKPSAAAKSDEAFWLSHYGIFLKDTRLDQTFLKPEQLNVQDGHDAPTKNNLEKPSTIENIPWRGRKKTRTPESDYPSSTQLFLAGEQYPAYFAFPLEQELVDYTNQAEFWASSANRQMHLMQFSLGDGRVTLVSSNRIWQDGFIHQWDHAWLLRYLTQQTRVILVPHWMHYPLLHSLWAYAPLVLVAITLSLLFWSLSWLSSSWLPISWMIFTARGSKLWPRINYFWHKTPLGQRSLIKKSQTKKPQMKKTMTQRTLVSTHQEMIQNIQRQVLVEASGANANLFTMTMVKQREYLVQRSGSTAKHVREAMRLRDAKSITPKIFTQQIQYLKQLREML